MKRWLIFLAVVLSGTAYAQSEGVEENRDSLFAQGLGYIIKPGYVEWDSLQPAPEHNYCAMLDANGALFTGTAYKIEYGKHFEFLRHDEDSAAIRVKTIPFVNGFRNGVARVIDPMQDFLFIEAEGYEWEMEEVEFHEMQFSEWAKKIVFTFSNFEVEYYDVSAMVHFEDEYYFSLDGTELTDFQMWELVGSEGMSKELAFDEYKNKYLCLTLTTGFGGTGEQYGHYETDHSRLYYDIPPYDCGIRTTISNIEVLEDFKPVKKE